MEAELIPHLFRTEYSRILAVLIRSFGMESIETAEDLASETFITAMETWPYKGIPDNPQAWLYTVAKNKARNHFKKIKGFENTFAELTQNMVSDQEFEINLSEHHIQDSQLSMLFAIAHPELPPEASVALALRTVCGFGIDEIASAFLSNKETINKRLYRAREKLRELKIKAELPAESQLSERLQQVLKIIYLLFSEGYYSESHKELIREELCAEAIQLNYLLLKYPPANTHESNSLMSLMCFHASRLAARKGPEGTQILYHDQDTRLWNSELIEKGFHYLMLASGGDQLSAYYTEASIAYWHTVNEDHPGKWKSILQLYDVLMNLSASPMVALNRLYAVMKVHGAEAALKESEMIRMPGNRYYHVLMAELHQSIDTNKAISHLQTAIELCYNEKEKEVLRKRVKELGSRI